MPNLVALIPARGGSKRLRGKNLLEVGGLPLVAYAIRAVRTLEPDTIIVSTDDDTIAAVAEVHGATVDRSFRHTDATSVDQVAEHYLRSFFTSDLLVYQPTMVIDPSSEYEVLRTFVDSVNRTGINVVTAPLGIVYQAQPASVGGLRPKIQADRVGPEARNGAREVGIRLYPQGAGHANVWIPHTFTTRMVDIDTPADLLAARSLVDRLRMHFIVAYGHEIGSGHLRRVAELMGQLQHHRLSWSLKPGTDYTAATRHPVQSTLGPYATQYGSTNAVDARPDVIVRDALESTDPQMRALRRIAPVVALEDRGEGAWFADLHIDSLADDAQRHLTVLRPEFSGLPPRTDRGEGVLVTFGGTDPSRLTYRAMKALAGYAPLRVVVPPGAPEEYVDRLTVLTDSLNEEGRQQGLRRIELLRSPVMVTEMRNARVVVCSYGRTVLEAAACGTPVVAVAQNAHELGHRHVSQGYGALPLGDSTVGLRAAVKRLYLDETVWHEWSKRASDSIDGYGSQRVAAAIVALGMEHKRRNGK